MLTRVARTVQRYRMFEPGQRVAVAVSGGADSVGLLHLLLELAPEWQIHLTVVHLNHRLRGVESDGDEQFVRDLAARLHLPATVRSADLAAAPGNLEQAARRARLALFRELLASGEANRVATGHTRDDQAETVLFRFLRGSGSAGLAAIRPVTAEGIVRPLLDIRHAELESYLRERSIPWHEDSTNASPQFARNRIRHELLPQLARDWNPALSSTLAHTADWALAEEQYWDAEITRLTAGHLEERDGAILLRADWLQSLHPAVARRVVRRAFERVKGDLRAIGFHHIASATRLSGLPSGRGRLEAPGVVIARSFEWLRIAPAGPQPEPYCVPAPVPGAVSLARAGTTIYLELVERPETIASSDCVYNKGTDCVDWHTLSGPLQVRNWRPGDRYQPRGCSAEEKIKTLFQKSRIPLWERSQWPVVISGAHIVWTRRFGPAACFAADTSSAVVLTIREGRREVESAFGRPASKE